MGEFSREGAFDHRPEPDRGGRRRHWPGTILGLLILAATIATAYAVYPRERDPGVARGEDPVILEASHAGVETASPSVLPEGFPRASATAGSAAPQEAGFRVPQPGDPEWADYQEMLRHPAYRSSVENAPGYAMPYDPEWRSLVVGRREAPPTDLEFVGGARSLKELGEFTLLAAQDGDAAAMLDLALTRDEFELILWREFPQSRPFLRIPAGEAWGFHYADLTKGISQASIRLGKTPYTFESIQAGSVREFRNFRLLEGVNTTLRNEDTGALVPMPLVEVAVERDGRFKVYKYAQ